MVPYRTRDDAWLNLPIGQRLDVAGLSINIADLAFLLQEKPAVWQKVTLEDRRFKDVRLLIKQRETLLLTEAWPLMAKAGMQIMSARYQHEIETILGPHIVHQLRVRTHGIITMIDEDVKTCWETIAELRAALIEIRPGYGFVKITLPDEAAR